MFWKPKPPTAPASLNTSAASIPEQIDLNQSTQPTHPHDELIATALPTPPQSRDASYVGHINSLDVDDSESDGEEDGEDDGVLYRSMVEAGNVAVGEIRGGGGLSSEEDQGVSYLGDLGEEECDFEREVDVTVDDEVLHEDLGEDLGEGSPVREKKNPGQCFSPEGVERWKGIEPATDRDSPATSLDAPSTSLGAPSTSLEGGANLPQSPQTDTPQRASVTTPVSTGGDEWREAVSVSGKVRATQARASSARANSATANSATARASGAMATQGESDAAQWQRKARATQRNSKQLESKQLESDAAQERRSEIANFKLGLLANIVLPSISLTPPPPLTPPSSEVLL